MFIKQTGIWLIEKELHIIKKGFRQWHGQNQLEGLEKLNYGEESPFQTDPSWGRLKGLKAGRRPGILMTTARLLHWIWRHCPESKSRLWLSRKMWGRYIREPAVEEANYSAVTASLQAHKGSSDPDCSVYPKQNPGPLTRLTFHLPWQMLIKSCWLNDTLNSKLIKEELDDHQGSKP